MKFVPLNTIKQGRDIYEKGKQYDLPPEVAGYFVGIGWAAKPEDYASKSGEKMNKATVAVQPHDAANAQKAG